MENIIQALTENWAEALVLFLVFVKGILNLIPTQQPVVLFSFIDWLIDYIVPNRLEKAQKRAKK
jgi:hypothetical protein